MRTRCFAKNVFGEIDLKVNTKRVNVPACIILILKKYFNITDFGSFVSYLPKKLFIHSGYHRLAVLLSFVTDEGTIYDNIIIRMANKRIMNDIRKLILSLGYDCMPLGKMICGSGRRGYKISLSNLDLKKLSIDIEKLCSLFPTCNLAQKQESFNYLVSHGCSCARKRYFGETKELLLRSLKGRRCKTQELATLLGISRRTTSIHLDELEKQDKVHLFYTNPKGAKVWASKLY